jgi:diguanylate cyclase (GGDEF)-like protein
MESSSSDNRRRARLATRQPASVNALGVTLACEVRNYCRVGLFLQFVEPQEGRAAAASWRRGMLVEVVFTTTVQGKPRLVRIAGEVAHLSAEGAGLSVPSMSSDALLALHAAPASPAVPLRKPESAPAVPAAPAVDGNPGPPLQASCMAMFETTLRSVFDELFAGLDLPFERAHDRSADARERQWLRDAPRTLRSARPSIERAFFDAANAYQEQLRQRAAVVPASPSEELSLLEESEFEDFLNLAAVVNRLESDGLYGPKLVLVERLYGRLLNQRLDRRRNPFGPGMICQQVQQAVRGQLESNIARAVAYRAFGEVLQRQLPSLVDPLAEALTAWDEDLDQPEPAVPHLPAEPPSKAETVPTLPGERAETASATAGSSAEQTLLPAANPSPAQEPLPQSLLAVAQGLLRAVDQMQARAATRETTSRVSQDQTGRATQPQELQALIDATMARSGWMGLRETVQTPFSLQLSKAGGGLEMLPQVQNALDSAASLLGQAQVVSGGGAAIDGLLKRLERPLLKLALQDGGFLDHADHPARQVVDLVEQFAMAVDDDGRFLDPTLQRFLHTAVERVHSQADEDPQIYARTRDSMVRLLDPLREARQTRVARVMEACESRLRFRQAHQRVDQALESRLSGQRVPQVVMALLGGGWRQALAMLEFRVGQDAQAWHSELDLVNHVVDLLASDGSALDAASALERRRACLDASGRIEALLAGVNTDVSQREALINDLQAALEVVVTGQDRLARVPYACSTTSALNGPEAAEPDGAADVHARAAEIPARVGDWWFMRRDSAWIPMQLIWISSTAQDCALTNRSATRHQELTVADFGRRVREGTIKAWSDQTQPLVERSVQAMLDEGREQALRHSLRDPITGLLNRKGFLQQVAQMKACSHSEHTHLLAMVEFDQFRVVSQACGVALGEGLARTLSSEVRACVGAHGVVASYREDTFAVLLPDSRLVDGLVRLDALLEKLSDYRFQAAGQGFSIGLNIGVAEFNPGLQEPDAAVQQADMACVAAKTQGRNRLQRYEPQSQHLRHQQELVDWAGRIDSLLTGSGLHLRGQMVKPISANSGLKPYYEVLLGIELTTGRAVSPMPFVVALEGLRRAHELDLWVLRRAFGWIRENQAAFAELGGFSINLSAMSLANAELIAALQGYMLAGDIPAERISFEITETAAIQSYGAAADFIRQMRRFGCRFALDDFGSGHTSYGHLKNLRADVLKIDGSFVKDIVDNPADYAIVKSMNDIAHSLGMKTVAEYVESPAIHAKLREIGVDYAQGYAIHKPCRLEQLLVPHAPPRSHGRAFASQALEMAVALS